MIELNRLKELLHYNPETGVWTWLNPSLVNKKPINAEAGTISVHGYRIITIAGTKYRASRLAWFYMTGEWPTDEMDHIDRNGVNDRWTNLRIVSRSENALNRDVQSNNASGARGVHWDETRSKWFVQVKKDNINHFIGRFDDFDEAIEARDRASAELHGEFAELNQKVA